MPLNQSHGVGFLLFFVFNHRVCLVGRCRHFPSAGDGQCYATSPWLIRSYNNPFSFIVVSHPPPILFFSIHLFPCSALCHLVSTFVVLLYTSIFCCKGGILLLLGLLITWSRMSTVGPMLLLVCSIYGYGVAEQVFGTTTWLVRPNFAV